MKSSFLLTILVTALTATVASAQMNARPSHKELQKTTFDKFSERLSISYSGTFTSPTLRDMKEGNWEYATLYRGWDKDKKNRDTWPTNIWHQFSFSYNFGAPLKFFINPRLMTPLAHPVAMKAPEDRAFIMLDDFLVGFAGVIYSSDDKALNLWIRPAMRLPTSVASRNTGNGGAGSTTRQMDMSYNITYDLNKTWQIGFFQQFRQWVIEDHFDMTRFRIYSSPFIQYTINDISRLVLYYENYQETDKRGNPPGDRDPVFYDKTQDVYIGYSYDITPKLNVMPLAAVYINDVPLSDRSVYVGAQLAYTIK